jgi:betaine lipid synthase
LGILTANNSYPQLSSFLIKPGEKLRMSKVIKPTPRTNIVGAHEQGVSVATGRSLKRAEKKALYSYKRLYAGLAVAVGLIATDWIPAKSTLGLLKSQMKTYVSAIAYMPSGLQFVTLASLVLVLYVALTQGRPYFVFAYNCFLKPFLQKGKPAGIDSNEHQQRLEQFYEGQAEVYDVTRKR